MRIRSLSVSTSPFIPWKNDGILGGSNFQPIPQFSTPMTDNTRFNGCSAKGGNWKHRWRLFHFLCYPKNGPRPALQSPARMEGEPQREREEIERERQNETHDDETVGK
ncbi:hypothetical protein FQN60_013863 [Etheostoma spectabile]|uniref:Uncharacterized protein n=1 Tax=Etheostoma spectabile TaxID=54343 RepID=A0A5J5CIY8_9PERO|nr:hypothetical protein FQN60_013863 [Etheostoma spectabile]